MIQHEACMVIEALAASEWRRSRRDDWALRSALTLYRRARWQARTRHLWSILSGRSVTLFDLNALGPQTATPGYDRLGVCSVQLDCIRGSEGRSCDFDSCFSPRGGRLRSRWLSVAAARLWRQPLPPVHLVQIGSCYFVRDGHHRVSVARTLGQQYIDAKVTVWHVRGPLPWEGAGRRQTLWSRIAGRA